MNMVLQYFVPLLSYSGTDAVQVRQSSEATSGWVMFHAKRTSTAGGPWSGNRELTRDTCGWEIGMATVEERTICEHAPLSSNCVSATCGRRCGSIDGSLVVVYEVEHSLYSARDEGRNRLKGFARSPLEIDARDHADADAVRFRRHGRFGIPDIRDDGLESMCSGTRSSPIELWRSRETAGFICNIFSTCTSSGTPGFTMSAGLEWKRKMKSSGA